MICVGCRADNDEHRRYCGACGEGLIRWCGDCSFKNKITDAFCGGCGESIADVVQPSPPPTSIRGPMKTPPPAVKVLPALTEKSAPSGLLSLGEIRALIVPKSAPVAVKPLNNKVSQAELDALFGTP